MNAADSPQPTQKIENDRHRCGRGVNLVNRSDRATQGSFPSARFEPIAEAGHLADIERPERVLDLTRQLAARPAGRVSHRVDAVDGE
jgi:hypothetical protein